MSTTVSYKGQTLATVSNQTKTLLTEGKYLEDDLTLTDVSGGGAVLGTKSIFANGTYEAEDDSLDGYSEVTVAVPNTYTAGDEGKVVSNGALVAQTAHADVTPTTSDQTIDTTTNDSIKVKGDADLVASNIKKDVEIFGVTGSYEGGGGGGGYNGTFTPTERTGVYTFYAPNCTYLACGLSAPADTSTGLAFTYAFFCYSGHYYGVVSNNSGSGASGFANVSSNPTVSYSNGTFTVNWGGTISNTTRVPQVGATYVWTAW